MDKPLIKVTSRIPTREQYGYFEVESYVPKYEDAVEVYNSLTELYRKSKENEEPF